MEVSKSITGISVLIAYFKCPLKFWLWSSQSLLRTPNNTSFCLTWTFGTFSKIKSSAISLLNLFVAMRWANFALYQMQWPKSAHGEQFYFYFVLFLASWIPSDDYVIYSTTSEISSIQHLNPVRPFNEHISLVPFLRILVQLNRSFNENLSPVKHTLLWASQSS